MNLNVIKDKEIIPDRYLVDVQQPKGVVAPRGYKAFVRPYAHLISGKPISTHFYSDCTILTQTRYSKPGT